MTEKQLLKEFNSRLPELTKEALKQHTDHRYITVSFIYPSVLTVANVATYDRQIGEFIDLAYPVLIKDNPSTFYKHIEL